VTEMLWTGFSIVVGRDESNNSWVELSEKNGQHNIAIWPRSAVLWQWLRITW